MRGNLVKDGLQEFLGKHLGLPFSVGFGSGRLFTLHNVLGLARGMFEPRSLVIYKMGVFPKVIEGLTSVLGAAKYMKSQD